MNNGLFTEEESNLLLATLLRTAAMLGYRPDRRVFFRNGKWQVIRELRDYIFSRLEPMIEDEVKEFISWFVAGARDERVS
jgi:hypothetical protein